MQGWLQVDPSAESLYSLSPYQSMNNNPISMSDPDGDLPGFAFLSGITNGVRNAIEGDNFFEGFGQGWTQSWEITGGLFQWDGDLNFGQNLWNMTSKLTLEAPQTIVGLGVSQALNVGTVVNDVNYFRGATVLDTDLQGGAFTAGSYIVGPQGFVPDFTDHLFVHEFGHYLQSKRLGPLYLNQVALPSITDFWLVDELFGQALHDTRWYEAHASRLAADYFDEEFGSGAPGFVAGSPNFFDRNSFVTGAPSPYFNGRWQRSLGRNIRNANANPIQSQFHWTDIPISMLYNGGWGLLGFGF